MHKYLELSVDYTNTAQYVLVGTGALILFIGTLACCCTVRSQSSLLYMVSFLGSIFCLLINAFNLSFCIINLFNLQYAGFLAIILVIELAIAASLYAYKDHLADGLHKGLNQSIHKYGPDAVMKSADFDAMQANVSIMYKTFNFYWVC